MGKRHTDEQRFRLIELVARGQATIPEAAARFGVAVSTAYAWLKGQRRRARVGATERVADAALVPTFARLVSSAAASDGLVVRVGGAEIQVRHGFDTDLLRAVVASLLDGAK